MKGYIYSIRNIVTDERYIGQTNNYEERINSHLNKQKSSAKLSEAITEYGKEKFEPEIIETYDIDDIEELNIVLAEREKYYISFYNSIDKGYNIHDGQYQPRGHKWTEESKDNLSKSLTGLFTGKKNPMYGRTQTKESIKKNRLSNIKAWKEGRNKGNTGHTWNEEQRKRQSEKKKGIKHTEEWKKQHSEQMKGKFAGKNNPMYGKHRIAINDGKTNKYVLESEFDIYINNGWMKGWIKK